MFCSKRKKKSPASSHSLLASKHYIFFFFFWLFYPFFFKTCLQTEPTFYIRNTLIWDISQVIHSALLTSPRCCLWNPGPTPTKKPLPLWQNVHHQYAGWGEILIFIYFFLPALDKSVLFVKYLYSKNLSAALAVYANQFTFFFFFIVYWIN